jgi:predicted kinase
MNQREVVLLVGMQGSGKTHYALTRLKSYIRLSQDQGPRTFEGVLRRLEALLEQGVQRIVIDRTNPKRHQRADFIAAARRHGCRTRIIHLLTPPELCRRRIIRRKGHPTLTADCMDQAIGTYLANFQPPQGDEADELQIVRYAPRRRRRL